MSGSPSTLTELIAHAEEAYSSVPAVRDGALTLTYAELGPASREFGAALVAAGVEPGDRVSIWLPNGVRWVLGALGLFQAGATLVPVNTRFRGAEALDILTRSRARVLVTTTDFLGTDYVAMLRGAGEVPADLTVVVASGPVPEGAVGWEDFLARATGDGRAEVERRRHAVTADDPSDILFTSGTTGRPKGVVMTHGRTLQVATDWVAMTGLTTGDAYLMVNPYFHMFGLKAGILACTCAGATMLPEPVFDVPRVLQRVGEEQVTVLPGPPTLYQSLLDRPAGGEHDLSSLRVAVTGSSDIPVTLIDRVRAELPFKLVVSGYGLTEAGTATGTGPDDDPVTIATTVGRARPGFALKLLGTDGADVTGTAAGEVLIKGPSVMLCYLDDPAATAETLADGWLRTGDIGELDAAGNLKIVGRSKDMFLVGGFNAYPAEIESMLLRHPAIAQVSVIGIPDERLGEVGMAFVVPATGTSPTEAELIAWSREQMANYKAPRVVAFLDALPLTATGKVVKDELRALAAQAGHAR